MGVVAGVKVRGRLSGVAKKVASGAVIGVLALSLAACSSGKAKVVGTLDQGLADYRAGNIALAKSEFEQLVKNDPNNKFGWYNLGVLAQYAGNSSEASADYQKALTIDPSFESALYNYGLVKAAGNDLNAAIDLLGKAATANPKDAGAHWQLGLALAKRGDTTKGDNARSTKELNAGLKLDPTLIKSLTGSQQLSTTTSAATTTTKP